MTKRSSLFGIVATLGFAGSLAQVAAHDDGFSSSGSGSETCLEPLKPIVAAFVETGTEDELRQEFELYFNEAEAYLNCLNAESSRVREEAQKAAYEYNRVLDRIPPPPYEARPEAAEIPHAPMVTSGHLNLDYRGAGG